MVGTDEVYLFMGFLGRMLGLFMGYFVVVMGGFWMAALVCRAGYGNKKG